MYKAALILILTAVLSACNSQDNINTDPIQETQDAPLRTLTPELEDLGTGYAQLPSFESQLPDSENGQRLAIPADEKRQVAKRLLQGIDEAAIINTSIIEPDADNRQLAEGFINFQHARLDYTLPSEEDDINASFIQYTVNGKHNLTAFDTDIMKKIIRIGGESDGEAFLQALLSAAKNTSQGCTYQEKSLKYGIIEFASCDDGQKTLFTLYKPS